MRALRPYGPLFSVFVVVGAISIFSSVMHLHSQPAAVAVPAAASEGCPSNDTGLKLPRGFCATVFADGIGHARDMVAAPNGVLYVNTWSGRYYGNQPSHEGGFLVALQDKTGSGKAAVDQRFGETEQSGAHGGTGIALYKGALFVETNDRIVRYVLSDGSIVPSGSPQTIVSGLPLTGDHPMHPFLINSEGTLFVDVASATNSCQVKNRTLKSPGNDPCTELETRAGIWKYDANKTDQKFSAADRYATGIRNGEGFAMIGSRLFVTQHGRDQLHANWPEFYKPEEEATLPAEELLLLKQGGDYGWPECYYDSFVKKLVLAPEYGGDGKKIGVCANKLEPAAAFPAHWAPNSATHYDQNKFPARYRNGVFIAFHGSWDRAPYPQQGYNVVFQPLAGDRAAANCEVFASGFAGADITPAGAAHRPSGLAVGPDGALYISDDIKGTIYRVTSQGGTFDEHSVTPCESATASPGRPGETGAKPPEGTHPNAGAAANAKVAVPSGATREMVFEGEKIYRGQVGGAPCTGCHGENGAGTTLGPPLNANKWQWSDGSFAGITKTINDGVPQPKNYRSPMPAKGGAQLTDDQVKAVAAYVWSLSHRQQ
jgi:glucose/arabinose dehydrogenase/mono/diheme cytochrome c family protein